MIWGHFTYGTNEDNISHYPKRLVLGINEILHVSLLINSEEIFLEQHFLQTRNNRTQ